KGEDLGVYRKTHLFNNEKEYITKGTQLNVLDTEFGKVGIMICYDLEFPEVARALTLKGAEYIFVSTSNMLPYSHHQSIYAQSRSFENEVPVVVCNRVGIESDMHFFGGSIAVNTKGEITKLDKDKEDLTVVNIISE